MNISIAIATYKRECDLKRLLDSIPDDDRIQICISNNASPDGTDELVKQYIKTRSGPIKYFKQETNLGANLNIINALSMCDNDYCLAMTDDDYFLTGSLDYVFNKIEETPNCCHFFSCINYYEIKKVAHSYHYLKADTPDLMAAKAMVRSHIYSGVLYTKNIIQKTLLEHGNIARKNLYVNLPFSAVAINEGQYVVHERPILIHTWENEVYWGVEPSSKSVAKSHAEMISYIESEIITKRGVQKNIRKIMKFKRNIFIRIFSWLSWKLFWHLR